MAITFVQSKTATTAAVNAATQDLVFDATPTQGNIIAVAASTSGSMPVLTGTGIDFFAVYRTATNAVATSLSIGWVQALPSATITATCIAAVPISLVAAEYTGISLSLDQTVTAVGASTTPSSGASDATVQANELWLGAIGLRNTNSATFSLPLNSFAIVDQVNSSTAVSNADRAVVLLSRIVSATGTVTAACTASVNNNWSAVAISLK